MFTFHFPAVRVAPDAGRRCGPAAPHLTPVAGALLLFCWGWPDTGQAAPNDVAALRTELEALKADYSARVQALEARIRELESNLAARNAPAAAASAASLAAPTPAPAAPYAAAPARSSNLTAFNPAVPVILPGNYASLTRARPRPHAQGRTFLLRYRLSQRDSLAQLGFRGSTAGVSGVLRRRTARAGRGTAALARAERVLPRARSRGRQRPQLPGDAA